MLKAIFNVMLYKNKELTEEGKMIKPNDNIYMIKITKDYVKVHLVIEEYNSNNDYYISLGQFKNGFEKVEE